MVERIKITDTISYIKASEEPLSADVGMMEGEEYLYLFDVGNGEEVAEYINAIPKKKRVILSHFHPDHMGNIGRIPFETVFFGVNTEKYFQNYIANYVQERFQELPGALVKVFGDTENDRKTGFVKYETVLAPVQIEDGVGISIYPVPNSHAKGSLLLQVDGEYIFIGDSLYSKVQDNKYVYNAQLLKEEMELLKKLPGEHIFSSHEKNPLKEKKGVVRFLEQIYERRQKNDAYIHIDRA